MENDVKILDASPSEDLSLITVSQLPIIEEQLERLKLIIDERTSAAAELKCTEKNKQEVKNVRAQLTKEKEALIERYKAALDEVTAPIVAVQDKFKECIEGYKIADEKLKEQISIIENAQKEVKRAEVVAYFEEYAQSKGIDFLNFDDLGIKITLSASEKSLKKQVADFLERVACDLKMIETQEDEEEILVEYKKSLNASDAITIVKERKKRIEAEKARKASEAEYRAKAKAAEQAVMNAAEEQTEPSGADSTEPQANDEPLTAPTVDVQPEMSVAPPDLKKFTFSFPASVYATSRDEAMTLLREFKPKLIDFLERSGFKYGK